MAGSSMNSALIITEGEKFEVSILLSLFNKLGFNTISEERFGSFEYRVYSNNEKNIYIIPGPKPQVLSVLNEFDKSTQDLQSYFGIKENISLNYFVYDVDFASHHMLLDKYKKYNEPVEGLVILSNPCIEVVADSELKPYTGVPRDYKQVVANQLHDLRKIEFANDKRLLEYTSNNIVILLVEHIKKQIVILGSSDALEHIDNHISNISKNNLDMDDPSKNSYERIFTMLYIMLSDIFGFTYKYDDSLNKLIDELMKYI
jgi:hypothetical protein